jgi:membrane protein
MGIAALVFGHSDAQQRILNQVQGVAGTDASDAIRAVIEHAQKPASGIFASVLGIATLLFGASGVFGELREALNRMWDVKPKSDGGIGEIIRERFFSFGMVLAIGFLLLVSLVVSAGLAATGKFFSGILPLPESVLGAINFFLSVAGISILFALIFKYVPETGIDWKDVWTGAIATAFLFTIGKSLIALYLGKAGIASSYGAAGSLMGIIVWIYYSSMIFFFGAEFTHVLATYKETLAQKPPFKQ